MLPSGPSRARVAPPPMIAYGMVSAMPDSLQYQTGTRPHRDGHPHEVHRQQQRAQGERRRSGCEAGRAGAIRAAR